MQNANDFAQAAVAISQFADKMRPAVGDVYAQSRNLIIVELRVAARRCREIAEDIAKRETANVATD